MNKKSRKTLLVSLLSLLVVLPFVGCQPGAQVSPEPDAPMPTASPQGTSTALPEIGPPESLTPQTLVPITVVPEEAMTAEPSPIPSELEALVTLAREDLAERLDIPGEEIKLVEARNVIWPDGSLGCPQAGMVYTQVLRDGALIRLEAGKQIYQYHSGGGKAPFLCENPASPPPEGTGAPGFNE